MSKGNRRLIAGPVVFTECNMPGSIKTRANRNRAVEPGLSDQPICVVSDRVCAIGSFQSTHLYLSRGFNFST